MKYILLAFANAAAWEAASEAMRDTQEVSEEIQAYCDFYENLHKELVESGEFVSTEGLLDPSYTKTVRKLDAGGVVTTDGPFAEAKEALVSFAIVDCASYDRAVEIAAKTVAFTGETVEVRPIGEGPIPPEA